MHVQTFLKTLALTVGLVEAQNSSAPVIDLGYELHQGSAINVCISEGPVIDLANPYV